MTREMNQMSRSTGPGGHESRIDPRSDPYGLPVVEPRRRSPDPGFSARSAVEIAELQDKLEKTTSELRRAQAEIRLNQSDYDRSHVDMEQMQEKVGGISLWGGRERTLSMDRQLWAYWIPLLRISGHAAVVCGAGLAWPNFCLPHFPWLESDFLPILLLRMPYFGTTDGDFPFPRLLSIAASFHEM